MFDKVKYIYFFNYLYHLKKKPANELVLTRAKSKSQKLLENCSCKYYCPVENCKFYFGSDKYLPTFHSLKNHFIRIHGVKTFSCSKCQRSFSIKSEMERHEESCGVVFKCSCGCPYASRLSLLKHARKKKHTLIDEPKIDVSNKVKKKDDIEPMIEAKRQKVKILPKMVDSQSHVFLIPLAVNSANTSTSLESCQVDLECQNDQRSLGCQTIFQDVTNETQEIACQTIYNNLIEVSDLKRIMKNQLFLFSLIQNFFSPFQALWTTPPYIHANFNFFYDIIKSRN